MADPESNDICDSLLLLDDERTKHAADSVLQYLRNGRNDSVNKFCAQISVIIQSSLYEYENLEKMAMLVHFGILDELLDHFRKSNQEEDKVAILQLLSTLSKHQELRFSMRKRDLFVIDLVLDCLGTMCTGDIAELGLKALRYLLMDARDRKQFYIRNGLERILCVMRTHEISASVQEYGCHVIYVLAKCVPNRKIIANQCLDLVYHAAQSYPSHSGLQHRANMALRFLTKNEEEMQKLVFCCLCTATITVLIFLAVAYRDIYAIPL
jgi:hypothetical protein